MGDRLEILPGVYTENITLLPFVSLASADVTSTDSNFVPGNALDTIIRAPAVATDTSATSRSRRTTCVAFVNPTDRTRVPARDQRPDDRLAARRRPGPGNHQPQGDRHLGHQLRAS